MSRYLVTVAYTPEARAHLIKHPQNRLEAVNPVVQQLGGKVVSAWLALADYDVVLILEMPRYVDAGAVVTTFSVKDIVKDIKLTPLMEIDEWIEAVKKVGLAHYQPPKTYSE